MAQSETYSDASPDFNESVDKTAIAADEAVIVSDKKVEVEDVYTGVTPNALLTEDQHLADLVTVDLDDLAIQERQKQLDLVTNVYGETGPSSDLTDSQAKLAALNKQKTSDENLP